MSTEIMSDIPEIKPRKQRGPGKKLIKLTQDPTYYANYWRENRSKPIPCENCGRCVVVGKMYRHIKAPICARNTKDPEEIEQIKAKFYGKV